MPLGPPAMRTSLHVGSPGASGSTRPRISGGLSSDKRSVPFSELTSNAGDSTRSTVMPRTCRLESIVVPPSSFSSGPMRMKTCRPALVPQWTCGSRTLLAADIRDFSPSIVPAQPSSCGIPSGVGPWSSGRTASALRRASMLYSEGSRIPPAEPRVVDSAGRLRA
jgi:hypothetical protein